jgi:hypothetical protein
VLTEGHDSSLVGELGQHAAVHQRAREIVSNRLVPRQIDGALSGDLVRRATLLTDEHMGVKLISRLEMRTGDKDRDILNVRFGSFCDIGAALAEVRLMSYSGRITRR